MLKSKLACIVELGGVRILPGDNKLSKDEIKSVVETEDGKFLVEDGQFVVPKARTVKADS